MQSNRQRVNRSANFERRVQLTLVVVMALPPYHLIRPFLPRWPVYCGSTRFDRKWLFFSFFFFPSLSSWDCVLNMQKIISALQFIFSFDSVSLLLFVIFVFTLIISNWILFLISSLVIWFLKFIFKFGTHSLNCYSFCFESFSWLMFLQFHP